MRTLAPTFTAIATMALLAGRAPVVLAQTPGLPVLQNAFGSAGVAIAGNFGGGSGQSFYGLAGALGLGSGKLLLSGAAGVQRANSATRGSYGARASMSLWSSSGGGLGLAAFAGVGGAPSTHTGTTMTNAAVLTVPAGASIGYRRAMGATRGLSLYASPMYRWTRSDTGVVTSTGAFRVAAGLDFAFSSSLGVTVGGEFGQKTATGGSSSLLGAAVTFVPGRR